MWRSVHQSIIKRRKESSVQWTDGISKIWTWIECVSFTNILTISNRLNTTILSFPNRISTWLDIVKVMWNLLRTFAIKFHTEMLSIYQVHISYWDLKLCTTYIYTIIIWIQLIINCVEIENVLQDHSTQMLRKSPSRGFKAGCIMKADR